MKSLEKLIHREECRQGGGVKFFEADLPIRGVVRDSRRVTPGTLFFAIRGTAYDGHANVADAMRQGASAVVVERRVSGLPEFFPQLEVENTRQIFGRAMARWWANPSDELQLVGVTGTNGKTTTVHLLREAFQRLGRGGGSVGTLGTWLGEERVHGALTTPDAGELQALLRQMVDRGLRFAAIEVSSIGLDQFRTEGCKFAVAVFTHLTQDHLDYHGSMEAYFRAKLRLFEQHPVSHRLVNVDCPWGKKLLAHLNAAGLPVKTMSLTDPSADFYASWLRQGVAGGLVQISTSEISVSLIGDHNLANLLSAYATLKLLGFSAEAVAESLRGATSPDGRLERVELPAGAPAVYVDFAHTEDGLRTVLKALRKTLVSEPNSPKRRLVTVFGCGGDRDPGKRPKMGRVAAELSDAVVLTSDNPRTEDPEQILDAVEVGVRAAGISGLTVLRDSDRRQAIRQALGLAGPLDLVVIAGKGHEAVQTIGTTSLPFQDALVVREVWAEILSQPR